MAYILKIFPNLKPGYLQHIRVKKLKTEVTTPEVKGTWTHEPAHTSHQPPVSCPEELNLSGKFASSLRSCTRCGDEATRQKIARDSLLLSKTTFDYCLLDRELLTVTVTPLLVAQVKKDLYIEKVLNLAETASKEAMQAITISSTGLKATKFNIHPDRLSIYQKTSLSDAEALKAKVHGKGKLQMGADLQQALEEAKGRKKEILLKQWQQAIKRQKEIGWKEMHTIQKDAINYKMGNCEVQAVMAINNFNKGLTPREIPVFKIEARTCNDLFIGEEHVVGVVSIYPTSGNRLIARFVMDPWSGHCLPIKEVASCHPKVRLNPDYQ